MPAPRPAPPVSDDRTVTASSGKSSALSMRGLAVGTVAVVITCFTVCFAELVVSQIQIGFLQLPPVVIGMLVLILGARAILTRYAPRLGLRPHELFTIYVMMLMASMVSSRGLLEKLIPLLPVPNYFATDTNNWRGLFFKSIPKWLVPWDPNGPPKQFATRAFFDGLKPGEQIPWHAWLVVLGAWGIFVGLIFFAYLCLAVILRRQWVDNEKLSFPLVQLPLEMIRSSTPDTGLRSSGPPLLRNPITWAGFAMPALLFGFNGLHQWYPSIPDLPVDIDVNALFTTPPYNALGFTRIYISLAAIGFFYLLPTDLLFSLWFFFVLNRSADIICATQGYVPEVMPLYDVKTYIGYQIIGAYFVLVAYMAWAARPHLARVWA